MLNELTRYNDLALRARENARRSSPQTASIVPRRDREATAVGAVDVRQQRADTARERAYETVVSIRVELLDQQKNDPASSHRDARAHAHAIDAVGESVEYTPRPRALTSDLEAAAPSASESTSSNLPMFDVGRGAAAYATQRSIATAVTTQTANASRSERLLDVRA